MYQTDGYTHVVALSGGADSTCMAILLSEREPRDYHYVYTPTGDELPDMIDHLRHLSDVIGRALTVVTYGMSLRGLIRREKTLPNWQKRFCTPALKIKPFGEWVLQRLPVVLYVGLRADEPNRQGGDYDLGLFCEMRYPLRDWGMTRADVMRELRCRGISIPPRTDCARCPFQRPAEWYRLWRDHQDVYDTAVEDEAITGHTWRNPSHGGKWDTSLTEMRDRFAKGEIPEERAGNKLSSSKCAVCSR